MLLTWSYLMVVFRDPGSVPENWRPVPEEESLEAGSSAAVAPEPSFSAAWPSSDGSRSRPTIGFCNHCHNGKPPRCHHCSVCKLSPLWLQSQDRSRSTLLYDCFCHWVFNWGLTFINCILRSLDLFHRLFSVPFPRWPSLCCTFTYFNDAIIF